MGRWPEDKYILDVGDPDGSYDLSPVGKWVAEGIAKRHNADCDAYEKRIAELEAGIGTMVAMHRVMTAELARTRAESLRVVEVGEAVDVGHAPLGIGFTVDGHSGVFRRVGSGCGGTPIESYVILKRAESDDEVRVPHHTIVQPVRLERWEDEGCRKPHDKYEGKPPHDERGWEPN